MIAAAILLSTLITAVSTRFVGMDSPDDDNVWLIDRLTGSVYKCQAPSAARPPASPTPRPGASASKRQAGLRALDDIFIA